MRKIEKRVLRKQADVYLDWRKRHGCDPHYERFISFFVNFVSKTSIYDITGEDVQAYMDKLYEVAPSMYERNIAEKAIKGFLGFYEARNKNAHKHGKRGRPPHLSEIDKIKEYRKMGLKYKEIETLTHKKISYIHRAINYVVDRD